MFDVITIGSITRDNFLESDYELANWPKAPSGKAMLEYSSDEKLIFLDVDFGYSKKLKDKFPVLAEQHLNAKQLHTPRQIVMRSGNS